MKTGFLFPGQGAQYVGMAQDFYENIPACREIIERAGDCLDFDLKKILFEPNELINKTEYTQACLLTAEICTYEAVRTVISADITAGLSLGEYAALVCAGVLKFEDAVKAVRKRGQFMEYAVPSGQGGMAAVIGLEADVVEGVCAEVAGRTGKAVVCANYNCPGQIVISGDLGAVTAAAEELRGAGARLVSMLNVSGPFHSPLLKSAGEKLDVALETVKFNDPVIPYVANVTAELVGSKDAVRELLVRQVSSSVRWEQSVRKMLEFGAERFVEIGPGKTLAGFMKRIDRAIPIVSVNKVEDLETLSFKA